MKQATVAVYQPFQSNGFVADVRYRGDRLRSFTGKERFEVFASATVWCYAHGFTTIKIFG